LRAQRAIGLALLCASALFLQACETTQAPVSERRVSDYRKASKPDEPAPKSPAAPGPRTTAPVAASEPTGVTKSSTPAPANSPPAKPSAPPAAKPVAQAGAAAEAGTEADWRPETYLVKRGDTLYTIALDHGLDYKDLASWNQLEDPNLIKVGQQLRLRPSPGWKPEPSEEGVVAGALAAEPPIESKPLEAPPPPPVKSTPKGIKVPYSEQALAQLTRDPTKAPSSPEPKPSAPETKPEPKSEARAAAPAVAAAAPSAAAVTPPKAPAPSVQAAAPKPDERPSDAALPDAVQWVWPTIGKLLHPFNQGPNPKGVAIGGSAGQAVVASAAGKVVYSGSGLRGYGKLIIIKHNNTYLSVYAHNRELLVKEGERVSKGQRIAEMGSTDSDRVGLHFEIRRLGKPVDPLKYLPPEGA
jgi:lipoprotein NlpD